MKKPHKDIIPFLFNNWESTGEKNSFIQDFLTLWIRMESNKEAANGFRLQSFRFVLHSVFIEIV